MHTKKIYNDHNYLVRLHVYVTTDALNCSERENCNDDIEQTSKNNIIICGKIWYVRLSRIELREVKLDRSPEDVFSFILLLNLRFLNFKSVPVFYNLLILFIFQ